jgi:predicted DNA binding CopG/RHH family protein
MKKEYNLTKLKSRKNPYAKYLKKRISIRIDVDTIEYFKKLSEETGMPYQNLMNLYLAECAHKQKKININWKESGTGG